MPVQVIICPRNKDLFWFSGRFLHISSRLLKFKLWLFLAYKIHLKFLVNQLIKEIVFHWFQSISFFFWKRYYVSSIWWVNQSGEYSTSCCYSFPFRQVVRIRMFNVHMCVCVSFLEILHLCSIILRKSSVWNLDSLGEAVEWCRCLGPGLKLWV